MEAIRATKLAAGMKVAASYKRYNEGTDIVEVLGVTNEDNDIVKWTSVKEALAGLSTNEHAVVEHERGPITVRRLPLKGSNLRLIVRDLEPNAANQELRGAWYYEYDGRFCRGSGAEVLVFEVLTDAEVEERIDRMVRETVGRSLKALCGFMAGAL